MGKKKVQSDWRFWIARQLKIPVSRINKFSIVGFFFVVWISFFDSHNLIDRYKVSQNLKYLKDQKVEYIEMIAEARQNKMDLERDKEKFAREKYFMHKSNEEVFIIEKEDK